MNVWVVIIIAGFISSKSWQMFNKCIVLFLSVCAEQETLKSFLIAGSCLSDHGKWALSSSCSRGVQHDGWCWRFQGWISSGRRGIPQIKPPKTQHLLRRHGAHHPLHVQYCALSSHRSVRDGKRQNLMTRDFLKYFLQWPSITLYPASGVFLCVNNSNTVYVKFSGFVVGHAGLLHGLLMLCVAYFIISLTILSICAISTNGAVEGGGAYCILNQSLCHIEC